jgi:hypothetical protein
LKAEGVLATPFPYFRKRHPFLARMIPVNQYRFYDLGAKLYRVIAHKSSIAAGEMFVPLMEAQTVLDALIKGDPITIDFARPDANALLNKLGALFNRYFIDMTTRQFRFPSREEIIDAHELILLRSLVEKFETSLAAELNRRAVYSVPRRGLYDARDLTENADMQFSEETLNRMPETMREEIRAAGRSLAFGLGTASCFHLVRAIEAALAMYFENFSKQPTTTSENLWKDVLNRLAAAEKDKFASADARLGSLLREVDARYRTPLSRPGAAFSDQEAAIFFGITGSLITLIMEIVQPRNVPIAAKIQEVKEALESLDAEEDEKPIASVKRNKPA